MATQLTPQVAGSTFVVTPTTNTNPDSTGNYVVPSTAGIKSLLLRFTNTFNPDIGVAVPATTGVRTFLIPDVTRFTDPSTGRLNWTYSGALTGTCEVYGF